MNRLSLAFFAFALLIVAVAAAAVVRRAGDIRFAPAPAAAESVASPAPGSVART